MFTNCKLKKWALKKKSLIILNVKIYIRNNLVSNNRLFTQSFQNYPIFLLKIEQDKFFRINNHKIWPMNILFQIYIAFLRLVYKWYTNISIQKTKPIRCKRKKIHRQQIYVWRQIPMSFSKMHRSDDSIVASLVLSSYSKMSLACSRVAWSSSPTVHFRSNKTRHTVSN